MPRRLRPPSPELPDFALRHRRIILVGLHVVLIPLIYATAFALRFDGRVPPHYVNAFWATLPLIFVLRLGVFATMKQYNGWWRHVGLYDLAELFKAVTISSVLFLLAVIVLRTVAGIPSTQVPRSVLLLDWGTAILCFGGIRFGVRWMREREITGSWRRGGKRTLIIGADNTADRLLRQVRLDRESGIYPVGLVDDSVSKIGLQIHGVPVLGRLADLKRLVVQHRIELVVVAVTAATRQEMTQIVQYCAGLGVEFKIVPSLRELLDGTARLTQLRTVRIEDLLGRAPVILDLARVKADLEDSVVAITGGAGSIGSEIARQVARFRPRQLLLLEQAESPLYFVHLELKEKFPDLDVVPLIADITNQPQLERIFARYRPDYVLHAAAYKHVPLMEANALIAVHNNVIGTLSVADCAGRHGVKKVVMISTDKAVNPSSVMGATKRASERLVLEWPELRRSNTDFRVVRFGNVLGSNGSVVPLFKRQIADGGPVTVTHPDTTRYLMTIPEAVQLVLQAAALPEAAGRISMLEMGEPIRILDMAEHLIRLSGLEPYTEMPIVFTGLRPGEKLHEELMSQLFTTMPTAIEKIHIMHRNDIDGASIRIGLSRLQAAVQTGDVNELLSALHTLVPEWTTPVGDEALHESQVTPLHEVTHERDVSDRFAPGRRRAVADVPVVAHYRPIDPTVEQQQPPAL
ncbi:MAG: polysaccharide biosynthesis protein [Gemmatimonadaceae bacterium]